jgi:hypothetical protein
MSLEGDKSLYTIILCVYYVSVVCLTTAAAYGSLWIYFKWAERRRQRKAVRTRSGESLDGKEMSVK